MENADSLVGKSNQSERVANSILWIAAGILLLFAVGKLLTLWDDSPVWREQEPITGLSFRKFSVAAGLAELTVVFCLRFISSTARRAMLLVIISGTFLLYRSLLLWVDYQKPCACLGSLTEIAGLDPNVASGIATASAMFLLFAGLSLLTSSITKEFWWNERGRFVFAFIVAGFAGAGLWYASQNHPPRTNEEVSAMKADSGSPPLRSMIGGSTMSDRQLRTDQRRRRLEAFHALTRRAGELRASANTAGALALYLEAYAMVDVSFGSRQIIIRALGDLAQSSLPARAELEKMQDSAFKRLQANRNEIESALEFALICKELGDTRSMLDAFNSYETPSKSSDALGAILFPDLVAEANYADAIRAKPYKLMLQQLYTWKELRSSGQNRLRGELAVSAIAQNLEALAGAGRTSELDHFSAEVRAIDSSPEMLALIEKSVARGRSVLRK